MPRLSLACSRRARSMRLKKLSPLVCRGARTFLDCLRAQFLLLCQPSLPSKSCCTKACETKVLARRSWPAGWAGTCSKLTVRWTYCTNPGSTEWKQPLVPSVCNCTLTRPVTMLLDTAAESSAPRYSASRRELKHSWTQGP